MGSLGIQVCWGVGRGRKHDRAGEEAGLRSKEAWVGPTGLLEAGVFPTGWRGLALVRTPDTSSW